MVFATSVPTARSTEASDALPGRMNARRGGTTVHPVSSLVKSTLAARVSASVVERCTSRDVPRERGPLEARSRREGGAETGASLSVRKTTAVFLAHTPRWCR